MTVRMKRPASTMEILEEYHLQKLHTGEDDDGNRQKLAEESAQWCAAHYDPLKQRRYDPDETLRLIQRHVSDAVKTKVYQRNRRSYSDNELAAVLHIIERESTRMHPDPDLQFTTPNNSFIAFMKRMSANLQRR
jgi:hypothetical protein